MRSIFEIDTKLIKRKLSTVLPCAYSTKVPPLATFRSHPACAGSPAFTSALLRKVTISNHEVVLHTKNLYDVFIWTLGVPDPRDLVADLADVAAAPCSHHTCMQRFCRNLCSSSFCHRVIQRYNIRTFAFGNFNYCRLRHDQSLVSIIQPDVVDQVGLYLHHTLSGLGAPRFADGNFTRRLLYSVTSDRAAHSAGTLSIVSALM